MKKFLNIVFYPLKLLGLGLIYVYKYSISPLIPHTCRFYPSCSTYAVLAIKHFGIFRGSFIALKRIIRCNPKNAGGEDFIPFDMKGEEKWLL